MEKLIELLNEYDGDELEYTIIDNEVKRRVKNIIDPDKPYKWCSVWWYSKSFGFIQWLVDNDKIKDNGIKPRTDLVKEIQIVDYETGKSLGWKNQYSETEQLIMYLSIQDTPIEYLCSILK